MKINATLGGVDTLACDIGGETGPDWDVQRFRIIRPATSGSYEIDLCKDHRAVLEDLLLKARAKSAGTKKAPAAPQPPRPGPKRLRTS